MGERNRGEKAEGGSAKRNNHEMERLALLTNLAPVHRLHDGAKLCPEPVQTHTHTHRPEHAHIGQKIPFP